MSTLEIILIVIAAFQLGAWWATRTQRAVFHELLRDLGITQSQIADMARRQGFETETETVIEIRLEQVGAGIYAYRKSDDQFLAQGTDTESLIAALNSTLTPCRVVIHKEDGADLFKENNS